MHENYDLDQLLELVAQRKFRALKQVLAEMNEVDIAEFLDELEAEQQAVVFRLLPKDMAAEVFTYLEDSEDQEKLIGALSDKELRVAVLCGVCLASANFVKMMVVDRWLMNKPEVTPLVALVVCLTLMLTVVCAKIVGCTLPMVAEKIGIDPAVMAAPFITTVVDALSLLIYFVIASQILGL